MQPKIFSIIFFSKRVLKSSLIFKRIPSRFDFLPSSSY